MLAGSLTGKIVCENWKDSGGKGDWLDVADFGWLLFTWFALVVIRCFTIAILWPLLKWLEQRYSHAHQLEWKDTPAAQQTGAEFSRRVRQSSAEFSRRVLDFTECVRRERTKGGPDAAAAKAKAPPAAVGASDGGRLGGISGGGGDWLGPPLLASL